MVKVKIVDLNNNSVLLEKPAEDFFKSEFIKRKDDNGSYETFVVLEIEKASDSILEPLSEKNNVEVSMIDDENNISETKGPLYAQEYKTRKSPIKDKILEYLGLRPV